MQNLYLYYQKLMYKNGERIYQKPTHIAAHSQANAQTKDLKDLQKICNLAIASSVLYIKFGYI
jgi:hypothetical protein